MKIAVTGGSGFIGSHLSVFLAQMGHEVISMCRHGSVPVHDGVVPITCDLLYDSIPQEVCDADAIIHLAGVSVFGRWTKNYKRSILESRVQTTSNLLKAIEKAQKRPSIFISSSAIGYYGECGERCVDENVSSGSGFLAYVCREWENAASRAEALNMRWVSVRTGVVLGSGGGILARLIPLFRWYLGGVVGTGKQWFSWIEIEDLLRIYHLLLIDPQFCGPVNAVSPTPVRYEQFVSILAHELGRPAYFHIPIRLLKMLFGESSEIFAMSHNVFPKKLLDANFSFLFSDLSHAVRKHVGLRFS